MTNSEDRLWGRSAAGRAKDERWSGTGREGNEARREGRQEVIAP